MGQTQWDMPSAPPREWPRAPIVAPPVPPHPPAPKRLGPRGWLAISLLVVVGLVVAAAALATALPEREEPEAAPLPTVLTPVTEDLTAPRVVGGDHLVALGLDEVVGLAHDASEVRWRAPCTVPGWAGTVDAPSAEVAVVTCDGDLVALDGDSGRRLWDAPSPPAARTVGPAAVLSRSDEDGVEARDLRSGAVVARVDRPAIAAAASDEERLYTADDAAVTARDLATGEILWAVPQPSGAVAAAPDAVFARTDQHELLRLDPVTGDTVARSGAMDPERLAWTDVVATSPGVVVLQGARPPYRTAVYEAETLALLWEEEAASSRPLGVGSGVVAVVDPATGDLVVHDERTGDEVATIEGAGAVTPAVIGDAVVFVVAGEGRLGVETFR